MYIWGKGRAAGWVGSGQTFCLQSRVGSGRRKVTRGQLWNLSRSLEHHLGSFSPFLYFHFGIEY